MKSNIGTMESGIRFVVGLIFAIYGFGFAYGAMQWVAGIIGIVLMGTAVVRYCPLWAMFGINTATPAVVKAKQ